MRARPNGPIWIDLTKSLSALPTQTIEQIATAAKARAPVLSGDETLTGLSAANAFLNRLTLRDWGEIFAEAGYRPELRMR